MNAPGQHAGGPPAVEIAGVSFAYPPRAAGEAPVPALREVSLRVGAGTRLGILGPNGGGKSTLVKLILGLLEPDAGTVRVLGRSPAGARRAGLVGYLPQRIGAELDWPVSVRQAVAMPLAARASPWVLRDRAAEAAADRALALVGMDHLADRPIGALSGGQLQRAMIARAIAPNPRLLVLDEPTVGVDAAGQQRFADLINTLHAELGITIITVSHDLRAVAAGSDRVACLHRGLHFHDAPSGLTPAILAQVFAHDVEAIFGEIHIDAHAADACEDPSHGAAGGALGTLPASSSAVAPPASPAPPAPPAPPAKGSGGCCGHDHGEGRP
jgi:zinc transport system ATP-binding protein